jgi:hypothetical protein
MNVHAPASSPYLESTSNKYVKNSTDNEPRNVNFVISGSRMLKSMCSIENAPKTGVLGSLSRHGTLLQSNRH